ncbi:MAG: myo-inositol-phosphate synthase [Candidatus Poribacteria bacterium]|nr:myo-inositol-phosphate synthase [Candidatus Poribacteria bacterium]
MGKVRVAIAGVGNCASALVQGVQYYKNAKENEFVSGLMHVNLGGYHIRDIEFVAAFDVDSNKVGKDLSEALLVPPNNTIQFAKIPKLDVEVQRGPTKDGLGKYYREAIHESEQKPVNVAEILKEREVDVLINYLPVGSEEAVMWYAEQALKAKCGMVNCIPVFIAKTKAWQEKFEKAGVPIVGDDIKSQVGATIVHRVLTRLFRDRSVKLIDTAQLNVGGNMDFKNMLQEERLTSKRISKTDAVVSQLDYDMGADHVHIGPSDYVPWLTDRKWCYISMRGTAFGDVPLNLDLKLEVWDSPNSAGIVIDALRCCKLALDRGIGGALIAPSSYFMKSPPIQYSDSEARDMVEAFIAGR